MAVRQYNFTMKTQSVLVTGSAGRIGRAVVAELVRRGHSVSGFDLVSTPGLPAARSLVGTLTDRGALRQAAGGAQAIIHLAATPDDARFPRGAAPDDDDNFIPELVPNNIIGPYAVLETARQLAIPRVILASSGQVVDGYERDGLLPVKADAPARPRYIYACTKVFLESLGQVYARHHGITVIAVRLGWCPRDARQVEEIRGDPRGQDVYLSPGDAGRFFAAAVEAESLPPFASLFATSRYTHSLHYDLSESSRWLGWEPRDKWPDGVENRS